MRMGEEKKDSVLIFQVADLQGHEAAGIRDATRLERTKGNELRMTACRSVVQL